MRVRHALQRNPVHDLARKIITSGKIGEIKLFKACKHVDIYGDPLAPHMWRADGTLAPTGIVGDTGTHVFNFMDFLAGRISALIADTFIVTPRRPVVSGLGYGGQAALTGTEALAEVTNPDGAHSVCKFAIGARGLVDFTSVATGRKFQQTCKVYGTKGSLSYTCNGLNRLMFYTNSDATGRKGFRKIDVGPENATFRAFLPLPNFARGYNETKIIEAAKIIRSSTEGQPMWPTFKAGHHFGQIVDACTDRSRLGRWVSIA